MMTMMMKPGTSIGTYRLEREIGRGGMANVWRAVDARTGTAVAIKILVGDRLRDPSMRARFTQEARMLARLRTPRIVGVLEAGCEEDLPYIVMELVEGETLERVLAREGPLAPPRVVDVVQDVAEALDAAHALGFVHRDVKPSNVMLAREGTANNAIRARLLDFGIAKDDSLSLTSTRNTLGSPNYMAPEQIESSKNTTPRTDVWALGVTAYQCLTGVRPFDADTRLGTLAAIHLGHYAHASQVSCDVPEALDPVIASALSLDPAKRPSSAGEFARALRAVAGARKETPPAVARILGGAYRLGRALARTSASTIYEGVHVDLDRPVAIKVLDPDRNEREKQRFKQEAQIAAKIAHPNLVHVIDVRVETDAAYIVLERLEGESLAARIARTGTLDPVEVASVGVQILGALEALHAARIVHRNIEPQNIFLCSNGTAKLVDFGLAKMASDVQLTTTGALVGKPAYAAPEQVRSERIDERTDLYALAAVMYHALSGDPPFVDEDGAALLYAIARKAPRPLECSGAVRDVIERALAKDPAARFQTAAEMRRSLA